MCEERERLIGYVYDDCDPAERQAIEAHLASCHTCRREIAGLRSVRQDLLAWDVPKHESVWRPMAPPPVESPWKAIPAWAMAAAAAVILAAGAAGGAATYAFLPHEIPQSAQAATSAQTVPASIGTTELSAMEQRLLAKVRAEMSSRVDMMSARTVQPTQAKVGATNEDVAMELNALRSRQDELARTMWDVVSQAQGVRRTQSELVRAVSLTQDNGNPSRPFGGQ